MNERERRSAEARLTLWEWVLAAFERRYEVRDLVWKAADREQAAERLRELLGIEGGDPRVVLDVQIWRLTKKARHQLTADVTTSVTSWGGRSDNRSLEQRNCAAASRAATLGSWPTSGSGCRGRIDAMWFQATTGWEPVRSWAALDTPGDWRHGCDPDRAGR